MVSKILKDNCYNATCTISKEILSSENPCKNEDLKEPRWKCRYVVAVIGFLVNFLASVHRTVMSVAIVAMVNNTAISQNSRVKSESCLELITNSTIDDIVHSERIKVEGEFVWPPEIQGYILGSFFIGHVIAFMPAGRLAEIYGAKFILAGSLILANLFLMVTPPAAWWSVYAVIVLQALRGLTQGMSPPCITVLMTNWCPKAERGTLYSVVMASHSLGPAFGTILAGYLSESPSGWSYAFYLVGGSGLALAVYILFFISENPNEHSRISEAELKFILSNQENVLLRKRPKLPWRQLLISVPLYALIFGMFGRLWTYSQFQVVHSTFLATILHYPIGQTGLFSALPFFFGFITSVIATWISGYLEKKKVFSIDFLRKFWFLISSLSYLLCLMGIYISGCNRKPSVIFSILSMGSYGIGIPGITVVMQDMSPTFAGTLHSIICTVGFLASAVLPVIVGNLTDKNQTLEQWNKVFFISIGVVMSSTITFLIFGSTKIQPWNFIGERNETKKEKQQDDEKNEETTRF